MEIEQINEDFVGQTILISGQNISHKKRSNIFFFCLEKNGQTIQCVADMELYDEFSYFDRENISVQGMKSITKCNKLNIFKEYKII
jgi:hypothetical protein